MKRAKWPIKELKASKKKLDSKVSGIEEIERVESGSGSEDTKKIKGKSKKKEIKFNLSPW